jgi:CHAT domain-containing protein
VVWQNGRDLEGKYHTKLKNSIQYKIKDSHSYTTYWQPLMDELSSIEKAYLSSDGVFHTISFNALWNSQTSKYLYEEIDIELLNNTKDLLGVSSSDHESKGAVLIGFPTYETQKTGGKKSRNKQLSKELLSDTTSRFMRSDGKITPLPGTKREIQKIDSLLRGDLEEVDLLTDIYATEQAVKHIKSPRILHIATHGFFLKDEQMQSSKSSFGLASEIYFQNPLMRSGLLLANAESALNQGGDGILTAYEVQNLNLEKTEIVVLSACETGIGDIRNGEGVYGLHRALQAAGASATLMSLWKVSDVATQKLMTHFYQFWIKENLSKQQAFKQAQIALRAEYPAPYYWASFVMIGY